MLGSPFSVDRNLELSQTLFDSFMSCEVLKGVVYKGDNTAFWFLVILTVNVDYDIVAV